MSDSAVQHQAQLAASSGEGWREITLSQLVEFQRGHDLTVASIEKGTYPVAGSNGVIGYHDKFTTNGPGITLGRSGNSIGVSHYYTGNFWAHNTTLYSKRFGIAWPRYVFYLLKTLDFSGFDSGSAVPSLNRNHIHGLKVSAPGIDEQRAIADVLASLDDKIDLLCRQNQTLEAMAETLFRQWFLEVPGDDWGERPLSGIATFLNGLACQKCPPANEEEKLPVLKIRELSSGITDSCDWATSQVRPEYIVEAGDVIFAWSASLMVKVWDGQRCVLNQHLFKVTSNEFPKWFYLRWCKHHLAEFIAISASHATTMGHIKRSDLDAAMVLVPPGDVLSAMTQQAAPLLDKQIAIARQRRTLETLRDALLSKLMSGEVRVAF